MAQTWVTRGLRIYVSDDPDISFAVRYLPEQASQTFYAAAPLKVVGGTGTGVQAWAATDAGGANLFGFSLQAGQNISATSYAAVFPGDVMATTPAHLAPVILATNNVMVEGNLLTAAIANYTLLNTDLGQQYALQSSASLYTVNNTTYGGWAFNNTGTNKAVLIADFYTQDTLPNVIQRGALPGDINARVAARVLGGVSAWF